MTLATRQVRTTAMPFDGPGKRKPVNDLRQLEQRFTEIGTPIGSETLFGARNGLFVAQQLVGLRADIQGLRADVQALTAALRMKAAARRVSRLKASR